MSEKHSAVPHIEDDPEAKAYLCEFCHRIRGVDCDESRICSGCAQGELIRREKKITHLRARVERLEQSLKRCISHLRLDGNTVLMQAEQALAKKEEL